jgi:hypothetical protein
MNAVIDDVLVGALLLASIGYAAYRLGPRSWRRPGKAAGACGGCDNCGTETAATPQSAATEIRIPAAKIGRRV